MANAETILRFLHGAGNSGHPVNPRGGRPFPEPFLEQFERSFLSLGLNLDGASGEIADESAHVHFLSFPRRPVAESHPLNSSLDEKMPPQNHWYCPMRDWRRSILDSRDGWVLKRLFAPFFLRLKGFTM